MEEQLQQQLKQLEQAIAQANKAEEAYTLLLEKLSVEDRLARIDN
jgi:hypothetical protein